MRRVSSQCAHDSLQGCHLELKQSSHIIVFREINSLAIMMVNVLPWNNGNQIDINLISDFLLNLSAVINFLIALISLMRQTVNW